MQEQSYARRACPSGYVEISSVCTKSVEPPPRTCPTDQVLQDGQCQSQCSDDESLVDGECQPREKRQLGILVGGAFGGLVIIASITIALLTWRRRSKAKHEGGYW